ncbi:hypothetical protein Tco_0505216 [Tanacetum coccineum]
MGGARERAYVIGCGILHLDRDFEDESIKLAQEFQGRLSSTNSCDRMDFTAKRNNLRIMGNMGRVFETRLRRRRAKQSGEIDTEFKTVNEYSVKVNKIKVIMNESA